MFCSNCGTKIEEGDKFCKKCGQEQKIAVSDDEKVDENNFVESKNQDDDIADIESESEIIPSEVSEAITIKKKVFLRKFLRE